MALLEDLNAFNKEVWYERKYANYFR
jgi:hypothetical protein